MQRTMRRSKQQLSNNQVESLLEKATSGVLALASNDVPYAVPLSYVYSKENNAFYFHCAVIGHKLDIIKENSQASFCVVVQDEIKPQELTTYYQSVIAFGTVSLVKDESKKRLSAQLLGQRYDPCDTSDMMTEINKLIKRFEIIEFKVSHMTGKQAIELCR